MQNPSEMVIALENRFWQSMVDQDTDTALELLNQPALMVSSHGAMKFDHAGYRKMAEQGSMVLTDFQLSKMDVMFPNDTTAILTYHVTQKFATRGKADAVIQKQEVNDTSTWVKTGDRWQCVMHTETPAGEAPAKH